MARFETEWQQYHQRCQQIEELRGKELARLGSLFQKANGADREAMSEVLTRLIELVEFPYEIQAAYEFDGDTLILDVDLPEIEELPAIRIPRGGWESINFDKLDTLDPVAVLEQFQMQRDMTRTGIFRAVAVMT
ncbi:MAG: hypothetical protein JJU31_17025 [Wenzhouxiangella sp.]|nr:hypothetical protein [Wenzhouxiangella sp.]TVR97258.1 MAG: hypothetical protein EA418_03390 [Wenzhouxiangellaceae bacterium]